MKLQIEYKTSNYEDTTLYNIVSNGEVIGYVVDYDDELTDNYGGAYAILKGKFRGTQYPRNKTSLYEILQYLLFELNQIEPDSEITINGFKIEPWD